MLVNIDHDMVETIVNKRLVELLYELDDPESFGLDPWDAAYTQDSIMSVLELTLTDELYTDLWRQRHGIQEDTPAV